MLSKEEFVNYLDSWDAFWNIITEDDRFVPTLAPASIMLGIFLNSHFTEEGAEFIMKWLFKNNKSTTLTYNSLFNKDEKYVIDDIDKLWSYVKTYLLYV